MRRVHRSVGNLSDTNPDFWGSLAFLLANLVSLLIHLLPREQQLSAWVPAWYGVGHIECSPLLVKWCADQQFQRKKADSKEFVWTMSADQMCRKIMSVKIDSLPTQPSVLSYYSKAWAWRVPFLLALPLGVASILLRRRRLRNFQRLLRLGERFSERKLWNVGYTWIMYFCMHVIYNIWWYIIRLMCLIQMG